MEALDKYTLAYWSQQIGGLNVRTNRLDNEWQSQYDLVAALTKRVESLEVQCVEHMAKIGELHARLDEAARVVASLTKQNGKAKPVI